MNAPAPPTDTTPDPEDDPLFQRYRRCDEERKEIWAEANDAFRSVLTEVGRWFVGNYRQDMLARYRLGLIVKRLEDDHMDNRARRYGSRAVWKLRQYFGWESETLYAALRVARTFSPQEMEAFSTMRLADGRPLCYWHVELLSGVPYQDRREELLRRTLEESWTGRDLLYHIHQLPVPGKDSDGRGRPYAVPGSLEALLRQQGRSADDFLNRAERVWQQEGSRPAAFLVHRSLWPREEAEALAEQLKGHAEKLERLAEVARAVAQEVQQARDHLQEVLAPGGTRAGEPEDCLLHK